MSAQDEARAARAGAALFRRPERGLLEVRGEDRVRWLDGMLSNDVTALAPGPERSGCPALLLTRTGRIVADPHVWLRPDAFWLELEREVIPRVMETLERFIVADRIELQDVSEEWLRLAIEGPGAPAALEAALGAPLPLARDACAEALLAGGSLVVAAYGYGAATARQLCVPAARGEAALEKLLDAGLAEAGADALEILRIEAGVPRLFAELDETVLPAEAHLERAISFTKGCYTGQEIVARLDSQGRPGHQLVGLLFDGDAVPAVGARLAANGRAVGEVTSACKSPVFGAIALGFVRAASAEPGTVVCAGERPARVVSLPFAS